MNKNDFSDKALFVLISLGLLLSVSFSAPANEITKPENLFDMSLDQLMDVEIYVPATLTEKNPLKTPASVTVISAEDIARTPARNLLDLIEIYVPGALYVNHSVGPAMGIRGIIADRPYKFLVNINGINVNIKAFYGARLELLNWDLNDVQRIEIVRGPGSVTYGPGAIGGVINIFTKKSDQAPGLQMGGAFWNKYNSIGNYVSYGQKTDKLDIYSYLSVVHTDGVSPDLFSVRNSTTSGYLGSPGGPYYPNPAASYMTDYYNEPQIKAHVDVKFKDNWRFWARYGNSSSSVISNNATQYDPGDDDIYKDFRLSRYRYVQIALENKVPLNEDFNLKSLFAVSSTDVHDIQKFNSAITYNDKDNLQNIGGIWSENEYFTQFMLNYKPDEGNLRAGLGFEFSYDTIRPGWGKNKDDGLRLAKGIMSGPTSGAYGIGYNQYDAADSEYFPVGNGWETYSYAFLGELNYTFSPKVTTIWSARLDKHCYTDYMFSPRFAWIYEMDKDEYLKFIAQRSVRMNTQEELYMNHEMNEDNDPEKLDTFELIYSTKLAERLSFQASGFYNRNEVIAWDGSRSAPLGTLKTLGLELETKYQKEGFNFGLNHSFVKQQSWELSDDAPTSSGISYSDYYYDAGGGVVINSNGNDLSNWANHASKLYTNMDLLEGKLSFHGNMQIFWGFEGSEDGLNALSDAGGDAGVIADTRSKGAFDTEIKANVSLTCHINPSADLTFFVQNIPVLGDNKRYSYSSGYKKTYPDKTSWIEEPTVFGVRYHFKF